MSVTFTLFKVKGVLLPLLMVSCVSDRARSTVKPADSIWLSSVDARVVQLEALACVTLPLRLKPKLVELVNCRLRSLTFTTPLPPCTPMSLSTCDLRFNSMVVQSAVTLPLPTVAE